MAQLTFSYIKKQVHTTNDRNKVQNKSIQGSGRDLQPCNDGKVRVGRGMFESEKRVRFEHQPTVTEFVRMGTAAK